MEKRYRTKATYIWANHLMYVEDEGCYKFFIEFSCFNWKQRNKIALVYDKLGNFVKTEAAIYHKLANETIKTTEKDHINYAFKYKDRIENLVKSLASASNKENILIERSSKHENGIVICFRLDDLFYRYKANDESFDEKTLECLFEEGNGGSMFLKVYAIPSLVGIKAYLRNHPSIRVKYVNELAAYNKERKI